MGPKDADGTVNVDPDQTAPTLFAQTCLSEYLGTLRGISFLLTNLVLITGNSIAMGAPVSMCRCIRNIAVTVLLGGAASR